MAVVSSGELNKIVQIMKVTQNKNDFGEYIPEYNLFFKVFASIKQSPGIGDNKEIKNDNRILNRKQKIFKIRYIHNLTEEMVLLYRGKYFTIENIDNIDEADIEIEILGQLIED